MTKGEARVPVALAVLAAVALQLALPGSLAFHLVWLLPLLEMALFAVLVAMNPIRIKRERRWLRPTSFGRIGPVTVANAWSAILVIGSLLRAQAGEEPGPLMASGGRLVDERHRLWALVLGTRPWRPGFPGSRSADAARLPVRPNGPSRAHEDWRVEAGDAPQAGCARVVGTVAAAPGCPCRR